MGDEAALSIIRGSERKKAFAFHVSLSVFWSLSFPALLL